MSGAPKAAHRVCLLRRASIGERTLEIVFSRPDGFSFVPGQCIRIMEGERERDYSLASGPRDPFLAILVRRMEPGVMTALLASAPVDRTFLVEGPRGLFTCQPASLPVILVATGTGAGPFLSMARGGLTGFTMLHGVRCAEDLLYPEELRRAAAQFVPCLSRNAAGDGYSGRVTAWARERLPPGRYDFYLCGRRDMVGDMTLIIDERFPGSLMHTEIFY